eukprot:6187403-Pleurochrysis_carterae.AAC.2
MHTDAVVSAASSVPSYLHSAASSGQGIQQECACESQNQSQHVSSSSNTSPTRTSYARIDVEPSTALKYFRVPSLRCDWGSKRAGDEGKITIDEGLWGVIFTMGIAAMRDRLLVDYDIEWWILHFFCMWGVIAASVTYSSRFNDTDVYHRVMWACFLVGIAGQIAFLDHDAAFFAGCTFFLYLLIVASFLRVAYYLPRARPFSLFYALCIGLQASIFLVLAVWPRARRIERGLFWVNAVFEAATHWLFVGITATSAASKSWDVPVTIRYIIGRYQVFTLAMD